MFTSDASARPGGRLIARRVLVSATLLAVAFGSSLAGMSQTSPSAVVREEGGIYTVAADFAIPYSASVAIAVLTDYERIPSFMPSVRSSTILERGDGHAVVEQEALARFMMFSKRIHLVLEVQEQSDTILFRDRCKKSFERYEGAWTLREGDGQTMIRYELTAKPSFDVPEFLLKRLLKRDAMLMITQLQTEIAARAGRGGSN